MPKLISLAATAAVVLLASALVVASFRSGDGATSAHADEAGDHPLSTVGAEVLALTSFKAEAWAGSTEGLITEDVAYERAVLGTESRPGELALVELSNVGRADAPPPHGYTDINSPIFEGRLQGPLWLVVLDDRPTFGGETANRQDPDVTDKGVPIVGWYNIIFLDATTGEFVYGMQGEIVEGDLPSASE